MSQLTESIHEEALKGVPAHSILESHSMTPFTNTVHLNGEVEWIAWQIVVAEFINLDLEINDKKFGPLIAAISLWGEAQAILRMSQGKEWMAEMQAKYDARRQQRRPK